VFQDPVLFGFINPDPLEFETDPDLSAYTDTDMQLYFDHFIIQIGNTQFFKHAPIKPSFVRLIPDLNLNSIFCIYYGPEYPNPHQKVMNPEKHP